MIEETEIMKLRSYLNAIEEKENIDILSAWVTGSYARGVSSKYSDLDIEFLYVQPLPRYAKLNDYERSFKYSGEHVESGVPEPLKFEKEIEFEGWDVKRFLKLLLDNNPTCIEALIGGIEIKTHHEIENIGSYVEDHFNQIELYRHYRSLTSRHQKKYINEQTRSVKKQLYSIRGALCAEYVRKEHKIPPVNLEDLKTVSEKNEPEYIIKKFDNLIEYKKDGVSETGKLGDKSKSYINEIVQRKVKSDSFDHKKHIPDKTIDGNELDSFMGNIIVR